MTEIRYGGLLASPPTQTVQGMGQFANDGWQQLAALPGAAFTGSSQWAFLVRGKIANIQTSGATPLRGLAQVCLGLVAGSRHPEFLFDIPLQSLVPSTDGIPFEFLVLITSSFSDVLLGSSWDPSANELCLFARSYWNGDATAYAASFDVADVTWQWFDLGAIPSGHWIADRDSPSLAMGPSSSYQRLGGVAFGADGDRWLMFSNAWYVPLQHATATPYFEFGVTPTGTAGGFARGLGNGGRWGQNRYPTTSNLTRIPAMHQGGFWVYDPATSTTQTMAKASSAIPCTLKRYTALGIRIDTLPDVAASWNHSAAGFAAGKPRTDPDWGDPNFTLERPALGQLTQPIVMMQGLMRYPLRTAYAARLFENASANRWNGETVGAQADPSYGEACTSMVLLNDRPFQYASPAMQWHGVFVGTPASAPAGVQIVHDMTMVRFHPVRDPENLNTPPGTRPAPIVLVPGRQSDTASVLSPPPVLPSAAFQTHGPVITEEVRSDLGYRRRWPLGFRGGRSWSVVWPRLLEDDARAVRTFLVEHLAWRLVADGTTQRAVMNTARPSMVNLQGNPHLFSVSVDVVELIWTGP